MSRRSEAKGESRRFQLSQAEHLNRPERIVLLILVGGGAILDFIGFLTTPDADPVLSTLSICTTLVFALYIWSPVVATSTLGVAVALSFVIGNGTAGLLSGAMAAAPVLRLASTPLIISYIGGLLVSNALFAYGFGGGDTAAPTNIALTLIVAAFAGGVGLALRTAHARGHRLEHELAEQAEREREAILAERRWIAGELHDSIAHYLTIIALHVQLLDDDEMRTESQEAIRVAARKALSDLRDALSQLPADATAEAIQDVVYEIGRREPFLDHKKAAKDGKPGVSLEWFNMLYQVLLGQEKGPRFGSFVAVYGIENTVAMIDGALARSA